MCVPGSYVIQLGRATDGVGLNRRASVPRSYGRRGPELPAAPRRPYDDRLASPFAGGRAGEPFYDALLPRGRFPQQITGRDGGG